MKLVIIAPSVDSQSGWGRYSASIIGALKKMGIDPIVVKPEPLGASPLVFVKNIFRVRRMSQKADVVHALDGWPFGVYGYFAVLGTRKKLFISGIGTYSIAPSGNFFKGLLLRRAYLKAKSIFCISNYTKEAILKKVKRAKAKTVFLGLPVLPTLTSHEMDSYKKKYDLGGHYPIILTVGEVKYRKGQLDTLKAIKLLKNEYSGILYIMVGSHNKSYVRTIREYARDNDLEDNIKFVEDAKDDKSLSFFYNACDIFALNSNNDGNHFEGFGLVLLEAAQFGKPVIGSRNCGIEDSVWDGYNGFLTNQGDPKDISDKIKAVLEGDQRKMAINSVEFSKKFSWNKTVDEYVRNYT